MAKPTLLKSVNVSNRENHFELTFSEGITGKIIVETEVYQENELPRTIKILLNPEGEKRGGSIELPKQRIIEDQNLGFFKQRITANQLSFFKVKVEEQRVQYNFKINIYQEAN
jgi:hypothetical protein